MRLRFGDCLLDTDVRELTRSGQMVPLSPKAFHLLELLAARRPSAVSQTDLRKELWPDTMMGGTTIARLVSEVRTAIGDEAGSGELIRTVHRFGYAFSGAATEETSSGATAFRTTGYAIQWGTQLVPLAPGENVIGRAADVLISVASSKVSRRHARILVISRRATEDLGSRNGTYINEQRINTSVELKHGDRIMIGPAMLIFCVSGDDGATSIQTVRRSKIGIRD